MNRRIRKDLFGGQRGIALPMALGIMMVLSIALVTVLELSSSGQRSANISKAEQVALAVAEAGLNHAEAVLANASDPSSSSSLPSSCGTQIPAEGGTFCYWGSLSGSTWTVNARSTVPNPSGGAALTHDVSQQLTVSLPTGTTADDPAWKYIYSDSPTGCMDVNSSVQLEQPIYVKNDLCLNSSVKILAASGELNVGGKLTTNSSVEVGTLTEPIPVVRIGGAGCKYGPYGGLGYLWPCTAVQRVWATSQSQTLPPVSKPPANLAYWYANAKPGPSQYCTSGSFAGGPSAAFDGDGTLNNGPLAALDLMPGTAYDCVVMSGTTTLGRLTWEPGSPHGTLTIAGTIFFDRDITINGSEAAVVSGRGTIYSSGKIWLNSSLHLCGKWSSSTSTCDWDTWDPDVSMLMFVSGSGASGLPSDTYGIELGSSVRFQGALYSVGDTYLSSSVIQQGPIVANQVHLNSSVGTSSVPYDNLTPGAPSATPPTPTVTLVAGSWRG